MNKLQEIIINQAAKEMKKGVIYYDDFEVEHFLPYSEQYKESIGILNILQNEYHIGSGSKLIILDKDKRLTLSTAWACIIGGIKFVILDNNGTHGHMERFINVWSELGNCHFVNSFCEFEELKPHFDEVECDKEAIFAKFIGVDESNIQNVDEKNIQIGEEEDICIMFSSGSTGTPKGVVLDSDTMYACTISFKNALGFGDDEVVSGWLPLSHAFGLIGFHLMGLIQNYTQVLYSKELFAQRPLVMLDVMSKYKVSFTGMPNFAFQAVLSQVGDKDYSWDFSSLKCILNAAEPCNYELCMAFAKKLEKYNFNPMAICPTYGMSEIPTGAALSRPNEMMEMIATDGIRVMPIEADATSNQTVMCVMGELTECCSMRIVSDNGTPVEDGIIGHMEITGSGVFKGYYDKKQNEDAFTEDGWFRTGDMGAFINNKLVVAGRQKEVIIINGRKIYPNDIEKYINECLPVQVKDMAVCGVADSKDSSSEQVCVFIKNTESIEKFYLLAKQVKDKLMEYGIPKRSEVIPVEDIIKTVSGKKRRSEFKRLYESGAYASVLEELKAMDDTSEANFDPDHIITNVEIELINIWKEVLELDECGIYDNFFDMGGNSVNILKMVLEAKSRQIIFKVSDVYKYPTVYQLSKVADTSEFDGNAVVADFSFSKKINYKVIDTVVSNNDTFSWDELSCFWRAAKISVRSYGPYYDDAFLMNLLFHQLYQVNGHFSAPYWRNKDEEYDRFFNDVISQQLKLQLLSNNDINSKEELLDYIVRSIDAGHPLVVTGDLFTIFYANNYREIPHFHYFVVKGYDKEKEIVYILDNIQLDNGSSTIYKDFMMKLDDLYETMMYVKNNMTEENRQYLICEYSQITGGMLNPAKILLEHRKLLRDIELGAKEIHYIESEALRLCQNEEVSSVDSHYFNLVMNEKRTYFKLITSLMRECLLSEKEIKEIEYLQEKIIDLWSPVRNAILDSVFGASIDMDKVKEQINAASEYEAKHREKILFILQTLREDAALEGKFEDYLNNNKLVVTNPLNAKIEYSDNNIQIDLDDKDRYDYWVQGKNAPRIMRDVQGTEWTFAAKVKNLNKFVDNRFHDGILVQFENGYSMMFGLYCENHNQMNISLYCPEAGDDCKLYASKNCQKNHEKLRVCSNSNLLCFQRYNKEMNLWETLHELKVEQKVSKVGIFAKSWIKANHSVVFSDIHFQ